MDFKPVLTEPRIPISKVLCSDQHQVFGHFSGTATFDDGTVLEVKTSSDLPKRLGTSGKLLENMLINKPQVCPHGADLQLIIYLQLTRLIPCNFSISFYLTLRTQPITHIGKQK